MNALFYGTVQATEEAILNAMLAATTMTGADGLRIHALAARSAAGRAPQVRPAEVVLIARRVSPSDS